MTSLSREVVVCVTAFDAEGKLDLDETENHLRRIMGHARTVLVGGSGTEEGFSLTPIERRELVSLAVSLGHDLGVSVRLNALEPRTDRHMLADIELARETGVAGIHIPILDIGHGYRPSETELVAYFNSVLPSTIDLPVYISSSLVMGNVFPVGALERAAEYGNVKGIVVGAPSDTYLSQIIEHFAGSWNILIAGTGQLLNGLSIGATGFVSPEGNIVPEVSRAVADAVDAGNWSKVASSVGLLLKISSVVNPLGAAVGIKAVLRGQGQLNSYVRPPRCNVDLKLATQAALTVNDAIRKWNQDDSVLATLT